jgi:hypothetical protein
MSEAKSGAALLPVKNPDCAALHRATKHAEQTRTSIPWNTAKLLVVGDETAGKTSLIRFLVRDLPRDPDEERTPGIELGERVDITQWAQGGSGIILNVWDFAGQVRTHGTHRYFFSERCLYLLVLQDRREDDRSIDYWLKVILNKASHATGNATDELYTLHIRTRNRRACIPNSGSAQYSTQPGGPSHDYGCGRNRRLYHHFLFQTGERRLA